MTSAHSLLGICVLGAISLSYCHNALEACSRIFWDNKVNKVTARSMDLYVDENPGFLVSPRGLKKSGDAGENSLQWMSKYGSVSITAFNTVAASEGINEKGLSAHVLYLHETQYEPRDTSRPGLSNALWVQYILDNFATVKEAVQAMDRFQIVSTVVEGREWPLHLCLEDQTGDSAIVEFLDGKMVLHHGPQYTIMTNEPSYDVQLRNLPKYKYFNGTLPLPGDVDPESRFVRCSAFLKTLPEPKNLEESIGHLFGVIRSVQTPFGAENTAESETVDSWPTRWVTAADVTNCVYYFDSTSMPNICWIDLKKIDFSEEQPVKKLPLQDMTLVGDITGRIK